MRRIKKRSRPSIKHLDVALADIAMVMLTFFLIITSLYPDHGIEMTLPYLSNHPPLPMKERNTLTVLINEKGDILVNGHPMSVDGLSLAVKQHVLNCSPGYNFGCLDNYSERSAFAVISIKPHFHTAYKAYIPVLDRIKKAYIEMRDEDARRRGYTDYASFRSKLAPGDHDPINYAIFPNISLVESDEEN